MKRNKVITILENLIKNNENLLMDDILAIQTAIKLIKKYKNAEKEFYKGLFFAIILLTIYFVFKNLYEVAI